MGSEDLTLRGEETTHPERVADDGPARLERFGRFIVLGRLGSGGAGSVHRAYDPQLDRQVAVKVLHACDSTERLLSEARAMAKLRHPNVVTVYDVGEAEHRVWLAMEYVEGGTLRSWLDDRRRSESEILGVFRRAGKGLAAAHAEGLVHRDFKPDNVLMHAGDRPVVTDFGLAVMGPAELDSSESGASSDAERTATSRLAGTPAYMSPEQFAGDAVGPASDQFSFGVALFEAVCRTRPFRGSSVHEVCLRVLDGVFEFPADAAPPWLRAVLGRMLHRDPAARFPSMDAAIEALDREPAARRRKTWATVGVVALAAGLGAMLTRDAGPACDSGAQQVGASWNPQRQAAVEAWIASNGLERAASTMPAVYGKLDAWSEQWRHAIDDACEATHVRGAQSSERLDLRSRCFDRELSRVSALAEELETADAGALKRAYDAATNLPDPEVCVDPFESHVPTEAEREAWRWHAKATARSELGRYAEGLQAVEQGLSELGDASPGTRAALLVVEGVLARRDGDHARAEEALRAAILASAEDPNPQTVADAWLELSMLVGDSMVQSERADGILLAAEAAVRTLHDHKSERRLATIRGSVLVLAGRHEEGLASLERALEMTDGPLARSVVLNNYGNALFEAGRPEDALAVFDEVWEIDLQIRPPGHSAFIMTQQNRARALSALGRSEEAVSSLHEALDAGTRAYGADAPSMGALYLNLGVAQIGQQEFALARENIERAQAIWTTVHPPSHRFFEIVDVNLGIIASQTGNLELALRHYRDARGRAVQRSGARGHDVAVVMGNEANTLYALGRFEDAARTHREALSIAQEASGADDPGLAYPLVGLARDLLELGEFDQAVKLARRAQVLRDAHPSAPAELYLTYIVLAQALARRSASDLDEARDWALAAHKAFEKTRLPEADAKELRMFESAYGRLKIR